MQLSHFRGLHYKADKKIQGSNNQFVQESEKVQNAPFHSGSTANRLAEQYRVSCDTIKRDAKLAAGINSIGEVSPDVKRRILAGEIRVGKNRLEALSSASKEEIEAVVAEIEEGVFVGRAPRNSNRTEAGIAPESILPEIRQLNKIISDFASNFNSMFQQLNNGDSVELKSVLRSYINQLEDLYQNIR